MASPPTAPIRSVRAGLCTVWNLCNSIFLCVKVVILFSNKPPSLLICIKKPMDFDNCCCHYWQDISNMYCIAPVIRFISSLWRAVINYTLSNLNGIHHKTQNLFLRGEALQKWKLQRPCNSVLLHLTLTLLDQIVPLLIFWEGTMTIILM